MQIDKPGKDSKTGKAVEEFFNSKIPFKTRKHYDSVHRAIAKHKKRFDEVNRTLSKGTLQGKNHGR